MFNCLIVFLFSYFFKIIRSVPFFSIRSRERTIVTRERCPVLEQDLTVLSLIIYLVPFFPVCSRERTRSFPGKDTQSLNWAWSYFFKSFIRFRYFSFLPVRARSFPGKTPSPWTGPDFTFLNHSFGSVLFRSFPWERDRSPGKTPSPWNFTDNFTEFKTSVYLIFIILRNR